MTRSRPVSTRTGIIVASLAIYLFWGSSNFMMKWAMASIPPVLLTGVRQVLVGIILTSFALACGHRIERVHLKPLLLIALLFFLGGQGCLYWGQNHLASGVGAVLMATMPLWVVLIEGCSPHGIRFSARVFAGLALGLFGVFLLVGSRRLFGSGQVNLAGAVAIVVAALCWAVGSVYTARARLPKSAVLTAGCEMLCGGPLVILAAAALGETHGFHWAQVSARSWLGFADLLFLAGVIGFTSYTWLLRAASPARVATYAYVCPLVAVALGWTFAGDALTPRIGAAVGLLLGAVVLIVTTQNKAVPAEMENVAP